MKTIRKRYISPDSESMEIVSISSFLADNLGSVSGEAGGSERDDEGDDYGSGLSGSVSGGSINSFGEGKGF